MTTREQVLAASITTRKRVWTAYIGLVAVLFTDSARCDEFFDPDLLIALLMAAIFLLFSIGAIVVTESYKRDRESPHWPLWSRQRPRFWMRLVIREEI